MHPHPQPPFLAILITSFFFLQFEPACTRKYIVWQTRLEADIPVKFFQPLPLPSFEVFSFHREVFF